MLGVGGQVLGSDPVRRSPPPIRGHVFDRFARRPAVLNFGPDRAPVPVPDQRRESIRYPLGDDGLRLDHCSADYLRKYGRVVGLRHEERCESGRIGLTANELTWVTGPRVQIPPSPPCDVPRNRGQTEPHRRIPARHPTGWYTVVVSEVNVRSDPDGPSHRTKVGRHVATFQATRQRRLGGWRASGPGWSPR